MFCLRGQICTAWDSWNLECETSEGVESRQRSASPRSCTEHHAHSLTFWSLFFLRKSRSFSLHGSWYTKSRDPVVSCYQVGKTEFEFEIGVSRGRNFQTMDTTRFGRLKPICLLMSSLPPDFFSHSHTHSIWDTGLGQTFLAHFLQFHQLPRFWKPEIRGEIRLLEFFGYNSPNFQNRRIPRKVGGKRWSRPTVQYPCHHLEWSLLCGKFSWEIHPAENLDQISILKPDGSWKMLVVAATSENRSKKENEVISFKSL